MATPTRLPLPRLAPDRHGVFTSAEASAAGWTESALRWAVARGRLVRLRTGVYAWPCPESKVTDRAPEDLIRAGIAAAMTLQGAVISHASSLAAAGLPLWSARHRACVTLPPRSHSIAPDVHVHRARCLDDAIEPATDPARTTIARALVDVAREHRFRDALVAADAALRLGLVTPDGIGAVLEQCARWPGIRVAKALATSVDPRSESPLESVSRLVLARLGLPAPVPQVAVGDGDGRFLGRLDFYWDRWGIAGEVDGRSKYTDPQLLWQEKRREDALRDAGLVVVRWGKPELDRPERLAQLMRAAILRAGGRRAGERRWTLLDADLVRVSVA